MSTLPKCVDTVVTTAPVNFRPLYFLATCRLQYDLDGEKNGEETKCRKQIESPFDVSDGETLGCLSRTRETVTNYKAVLTED